MMKSITVADTTEWIRRVLNGEPDSGSTRSRDEPETWVHEFIRNALGEPSPIVPMGLRAKALVVLLEEEQNRRHLLKQQGNNR